MTEAVDPLGDPGVVEPPEDGREGPVRVPATWSAVLPAVRNVSVGEATTSGAA